VGSFNNSLYTVYCTVLIHCTITYLVIFGDKFRALVEITTATDNRRTTALLCILLTGADYVSSREFDLLLFRNIAYCVVNVGRRESHRLVWASGCLYIG